MNNPQRAEVLVQALPYIQDYAGKVVVIKYGGNAMVSEDLKHAVMGDIALLREIGMRVVLVHGGGPEITDMLARVGKKSAFHNGLRVTDLETMEIVQMVLCGKINKNLVGLLNRYGGRAVGLCGADGRMIEAKPLDEALGYVGEIVRIEPAIINDVLDQGYIPVISTVGSDSSGNAYNINADTAAARIAAALGAECMISMTDIPGLLLDKDDDATLIKSVNVSEVPQLINRGVIQGGMIPKVECCIEAIRRGVKRVFIIDGRVKHAILIELLTDEGLGTMFK
ncbi:MAG: acetylglutamate kinase [Christensenellales bacterium]|jgi:acetylglutamate kinase